uniref:Uncharacterized protein n=1 Tax=Caenorhabditis japonica TaxID=281687 RepID=A0A8R1INX8_CAEJA
MALNLYVDNLMLTSDEKPDKAINLYYEAKKTFLEMNMNLREFLSNSKDFNEKVDHKDRAPDANMKVLGYGGSQYPTKLKRQSKKRINKDFATN